MKLLPYMGTNLAAGAFLLAGILALAQSAPNPVDSGPAQSSVQRSSHRGNSQAEENHKSGTNPLYKPKDAANIMPGVGASNGQPGQGHGMAVDHAGGNGVRRADSSPSQRGASASNPAASRNREFYNWRKRSFDKKQKAQGNAIPTNHGNNAAQRKHIAGVKYEDRMRGGGNGTPGMAVNEQGIPKAPARRRR